MLISILFQSEVADFQTIVQNLLTMLNAVAEKVEKQKLRAIVTRNQAVSMEKQRQVEQQRMEAAIEKQKNENER